MYWPYDEVSLDVQLEHGTVAVKSPWLVATFPSEVLPLPELNELSSKLNQKQLGADHLPLVHAFFSHLEAYPFAYTLPARKLEATDQHILVDDTLLAGDMREVFTRIVALSQPFDADLSEGDVPALFSILPRTDWQWDSDAALSFAQLENGIHPESLFTVAKRYHLLEILNSDSGNDVFRDARTLSEADFRSVALTLVRQNHYVTQKCQRALEPAIGLAQNAAHLVQDFRDEEKGHDKLLERTLIAMGENAESIPVALQTRALMLLLEFCARRNFLAFSMAVDAFERSNYAEVDPLAELLRSRGLDEAAKYVNAHMNINDHGGHENIAKTFLAPMALCSEPYAREAMRLMELVSVVMCTVSSAPKTDC